MVGGMDPGTDRMEGESKIGSAFGLPGADARNWRVAARATEARAGFTACLRPAWVEISLPFGRGGRDNDPGKLRSSEHDHEIRAIDMYTAYGMFTHHWRQHGWWNEQPACCAIEQEDHPLVFFFIFAVESTTSSL